MLWRREGMACNIKQDFNTLQENTVFKFFPNMIKRKRSNYTAFHKKSYEF